MTPTGPALARPPDTPRTPALVRLTYPVLDCCDLVRRGADRVRVAQLVTEYSNLDPATQQEISRVAFVDERLTEEAAAAAA
jgi:hypothetical protein